MQKIYIFFFIHFIYPFFIKSIPTIQYGQTGRDLYPLRKISSFQIESWEKTPYICFSKKIFLV